MMPKSNSAICLDLEQAIQLYPALCRSADKQGQLLRHCLDEDHFFRHNFCHLFPPAPTNQFRNRPLSDDPVQKSLLLLYTLARNDEFAAQTAHQMQLQIDRASQTCIMLDLLLQKHSPRREDRDDINKPRK